MGVMNDVRGPLADLVTAGVLSFHTLRLPPWIKGDVPNNAVWREDCVAQAQAFARHALFSDVDEFVVLRPSSNATTLPELLRQYEGESAVSFGSFTVDLHRCVDRATNKLAKRTDMTTYDWSRPDWPAPFAYVMREPICKVKNLPKDLCDDFKGHRKFILQPARITGSFGQHQATVIEKVLSTHHVFLLHLRGFGSLQLHSLCSEDTEDPLIVDHHINGTVADYLTAVNMLKLS
jgi:hypothetical protein